MGLFARFRDGFTVTTAKSLPVCDLTKGQTKGCTARLLPDTAMSGYSPAWYERIVADGDNAKRYAWPATADGRAGALADEANMHKLRRMEKRRR